MVQSSEALDHQAGASLVLDNLSIKYVDSSVAAVQNISFCVEPHEFVCIVGPSGSGKSSILNAIAGFIPVSSGKITIDGLSVTGPSVNRGVVFQNFALFFWLTVKGNVGFGPKIAGLAPLDRESRVSEILGAVGLADRAGSFPYQLSGGMQQRVAIARALINRPQILLMDEPFGSLDTQTREEMQLLLLDLWATRESSVVFVTHDIAEAIFLADRVVILGERPGNVKANILIPLKRPRAQSLLSTEEFRSIRQNIMKLIHQPR